MTSSHSEAGVPSPLSPLSRGGIAAAASAGRRTANQQEPSSFQAAAAAAAASLQGGMLSDAEWASTEEAFSSSLGSHLDARLIGAVVCCFLIAVYYCGLALRFYRSPFIGLCLATALFLWFRQVNKLPDPIRLLSMNAAQASRTDSASSPTSSPGSAGGGSAGGGGGEASGGGGGGGGSGGGGAVIDESDKKWRVKVMREMPPWMISPDVCKVNCINQLLGGLWPGLRTSIESMLVKMIGGMLTKLPFVQVEMLSLGSAPPLILGPVVKTIKIGVSPGICSTILMGSEHPLSVLSGRQPATF